MKIFLSNFSIRDGVHLWRLPTCTNNKNKATDNRKALQWKEVLCFYEFREWGIWRWTQHYSSGALTAMALGKSITLSETCFPLDDEKAVVSKIPLRSKISMILCLGSFFWNYVLSFYWTKGNYISEVKWCWMGLFSVSWSITRVENKDWEVSPHFKGPKVSYLICWREVAPAHLPQPHQYPEANRQQLWSVTLAT